MNKERLDNAIAGVFAVLDEGTRDERIAFTQEALKSDGSSDIAILGRLVSDVMRESGLSFNFSYTVASKALDAIASVESLDDNDALQEAFESTIPFYTPEVMQLMQQDWNLVDDIIESMGAASADDGGIVVTVQRAYGNAIVAMGEAILERVKDLK